MSRLARLVAPLVALAFAGCFGGDGSFGSSPPPPSGGGLNGSGKLLIAWTVGGAAPAAPSCAGIDHLVLDLDYGPAGSAEISPIPCDLTRFRYDTLPEGAVTLQLSAVDPRGCQVAVGSADDQISATLPSQPNPVIAVPAPVACH
jgi:hypothetical protein